MIGSHRPTCPAVSRAIALPALGAALTACTSGSSPTLRVTHATIHEQSADAVVVAFDVEATNPGVSPLPLREVRYRLETGDGRVVEVRRSPGVTIPADDSITFTLPVPIPDDLVRGTLSYELVGEIGYSAPGPFAEAMYDSGIRRPTVTLRDAGTIDLHDTQQSEGG